MLAAVHRSPPMALKKGKALHFSPFLAPKKANNYKGAAFFTVKPQDTEGKYAPNAILNIIRDVHMKFEEMGLEESILN